MSKIGKQPITLKTGVTAAVDGSVVKISGPKGNVEYKVPAGFEVKVENGVVRVEQVRKADKTSSAFFGLVRASLANILVGVEKEFSKKLVLTGVGYKASMQGNDLVLSLGFAHTVKIKPTNGVKIAVIENAVVVSGIDRTLVGQMAATIRGVKPPEPYKGKGIKYENEHIRRKAGKAVKAAGAK